nr:hypothetical protein [Tanacetum cinerariifolium]
MRHFKTLSLDKLRSTDLNLLSDQEYSEEEVVEMMVKTMEQYMSNTRADYGLGVARPKIENKDNFELKGQFLKELRTNTFSGSDHKEANEHIEKVLEIVDLFDIPNITINRVMLRAFLMSLTGALDANSEKDPITPKIAHSKKKGRPLRKLTTRASVSVMPLLTYHNLGLSELAHTKLTIELADMTVKYPKGIAENVLVRIEKVVFTSVKPASSLIKKVYMLSLRERMELDLEARLMGETLVLNRSLDPFFKDYIELNDLNEPIELRRNRGDNLMPTIKEGEVNLMSKKFCNSIMKDKMVYKGDNVVGALTNVHIFVGNFFVMTDFAVLENIDAYRDEEMGDIIVGESFLREARKNMMVYLKNKAGFKMDFFKGMTYTEIRPIFEKHFNCIWAFLEKGEKEIEEEESKRKGENLEQKAAKRQKIDEEIEELRTHLQIVPNDKDDVYTEATPLALKLFLSFITLLRNFDREDYEILWKLVQERFQSSKPKNFSDDFLLNTLKTMFEKPNVEATIWRNQRGRYELAKVKSWKLLESCGVHIITFTTTQMILLVERKYPLTTFTLEQMLNNVRLEVEEESEMSMELLRFLRR